MGRLIWLGISAFAFVVWMVVYIVSTVNYSVTVGDYLKRAGDANNIELAAQNLEQALGEIERRGWTSGNTGVLWTSPKNDIGFWYDNLTSALDELKKVGPEATSLEKTNVLMKLRESLLDEGENTSVTAPSGIEVYPNNLLFFLWAWASGILTIGFFVLVLARSGWDF